MAQAAYCSVCGRNVWVGPGGRCQNGHDASCLSGHYESGVLPPAPGTVSVAAPVVTFESTNIGGRRVAAFLIDYAIATVSNMVVGFFVGMIVGLTMGGVLDPDSLGTAGGVIAFVVGVVFVTSYFAIPEYLWGSTLGKQLLSLRVVRLDGDRISLAQAYGRNVALAIDLLFFGIVGLLTMNRGPYHQRVGDQLAKTAVIRKAA